MKKQLAILALAGLAFTAFKKDDDVFQNLQQIKKITEISGADTTITNITYDNSKRITSVKSDYCTETKLTYTSANLTVVENKENAANRTKLEITYDGAKPKTAVYSIYENNALTQKYKYTYTINATNQVSEILINDSTNTNIVGKQCLFMLMAISQNWIPMQEKTYSVALNLPVVAREACSLILE